MWHSRKNVVPSALGLIWTKIREIGSLIVQNSGAKPTWVENAFPTLKDVEFFGGRFSLYLHDKAVKTSFVLDCHLEMNAELEGSSVNICRTQMRQTEPAIFSPACSPKWLKCKNNSRSSKQYDRFWIYARALTPHNSVQEFVYKSPSSQVRWRDVCETGVVMEWRM